MTFTYDSTDLSTDLAQVRRSIGDTVNGDYSLTDEEINRHISATSDLTAAAVRCQEDRIAIAALRPDRSIGPKSTQRNQILDGLERHLKVLRKRLIKGSGSQLHSYVGQISQSRIDSQRADIDFPQPSFEVGRSDFYGVDRDGDDEGS